MEPIYCPETSVETTKRCKNPRRAQISAQVHFTFVSRDTVVGILAELRPGRSKVRIPAGVNVLALLRNVQTGSGASSDFCSIRNGIKWLGLEIDHQSLSRADVRKGLIYISTPLLCFYGVQTLPLTLHLNFSFSSVIKIKDFS